jgi:hypothetical protein
MLDAAVAWCALRLHASLWAATRFV